MKRSFQKRCAALLALAAAVGLLSVGCGVTYSSSSETQQSSIAKVSINMEDINFRTAVTTSYYTTRLKLSYQSTSSSGKDLYKNIILVSSDPSVASLDVKYIYASMDYTTSNNDLKTYNILGVKINYHKRGSTQIYATSADGEIISNKITVNNGKPDLDKSYITELTANEEVQQIWMDSDESQRQVSLAYKSPYDEDMSTIVWVVADPSVASMEYVYEDYQRRWMVKVKGTGETEIYAQTPDGSVVSNKVKLSVGNRYNKQEAVRNDIEEMVFKKLKYNAVQKDKLKKLRPYYLFPNIWYHRGQLKAIYSTYTDLSTVESSSIELGGQDATIRGSAKTFNDNAIAVNLNFVIRLHYSEDFTQYTVVSEAYDMPELIRANIG